jgi:uncharacterized membrane protein HdeD (DUF308 family)
MESFRLWPASAPWWCHPLIAVVLIMAGIGVLPSADETTPVQRFLPWVLMAVGLAMVGALLVRRHRMGRW